MDAPPVSHPLPALQSPSIELLFFAAGGTDLRRWRGGCPGYHRISWSPRPQIFSLSFPATPSHPVSPRAWKAGREGSKVCRQAPRHPWVQREKHGRSESCCGAPPTSPPKLFRCSTGTKASHPGETEQARQMPEGVEPVEGLGTWGAGASGSPTQIQSP